MDDFKLKVILAILSSVVFSLIFILLAFMLPTKDEEIVHNPKHDNILREVSKSLQK